MIKVQIINPQGGHTIPFEISKSHISGKSSFKINKTVSTRKIPKPMLRRGFWEILFHLGKIEYKSKTEFVEITDEYEEGDALRLHVVGIGQIDIIDEGQFSRKKNAKPVE